jgi:2-polyprenyl-3-methyl-5-hydroxy-6-metoxy-1,4-benzoquinol methylase
MDTDYDRIAEDYKRAKQQPWRFYVERYTLFRLIGDVTGLSVLDLACGEGYYSRALRHKGAARVVGVDLSEGMIALGRAEEARKPLGIEYRVKDARDVEPSGAFDLVVAAYLLNYARTPDELLAVCRAIAGSLRPGGRFVAVNNNPAQPAGQFASTRKYGFVKSTAGELREGEPIVYTILLDGGSFDITNYHLSVATHEWALGAAGLGEVRWHRPRVSPEGEATFGPEFWSDFLEAAPITFIECVKPAHG